jgi:hypothetical protein
VTATVLPRGTHRPLREPVVILAYRRSRIVATVPVSSCVGVPIERDFVLVATPVESKRYVFVEVGARSNDLFVLKFTTDDGWRAATRNHQLCAASRAPLRSRMPAVRVAR